MPGKKDNKSPHAFDHLNAEDRAIWQQVSATVEPFNNRPERPKRAAKPKNINAKTHASPFKNHKKPLSKNPPNQNPTTAPSYTPMPASMPSFTPNPGVDKRMKRKLGRGLMEIDARLDLHGKTREQAHRILKSFILNAQSRGHRTILVITGKGDQSIARHTLHSHDVVHTPERTGILMRHVPQWLNEPEFASMVVGFQPAHPKHGGGGAIYIRIRRIR